MFLGLGSDFVVQFHRVDFLAGVRRHTVSTAETTDCAHTYHHAFGLQQKGRSLEWSGVRNGENVLQPFNLCDRLLGIHSASIFTRSASPKESGFVQKLKPVPTGVADVYATKATRTLVIGPKLTQVAM